MENYEDMFSPTYNENTNETIKDIHKYDTGYNKYEYFHITPSGRLKKKSKPLYSTSGTKCKIRHAVSGKYFDDLVGTYTEQKYFKVAYSTGKITSANNSNTLFFCSPHEYEEYFNVTLCPTITSKWEKQKNVNRF